MKIPFKWLKEYVDTKNHSVEEISNALNLSGTENEITGGLEISDYFVVGRVVTVQKHPNADKLNVTTVDVGDSKNPLQIVCGAPNVMAGQTVPVALVGARFGDFEIKEVSLRGEKSQGMICSEKELGISDNHEGIMVLEPSGVPGAPLATVLSSSDIVLEAELTPNRSDCFSMIGIAREVAACTGSKMKSLNFDPVVPTSKLEVEIVAEDSVSCPRYMAKVIEGVKIGESPVWLRDRLTAAGVRPINNIVDVTNYVMLEWGQPMHAFDYNKLAKGAAQPIINIRKARSTEKITTLDGSNRKLTKDDLVISDANEPIAIAGVMGGLTSEVDDKTKTIILEAAVFNGTSVRKTAQRLALRTEASSRFEKGVPLPLPEIAIERAASLITEIAGGRAGKTCDLLSAWIYKRHVGLSEPRLWNFMGEKISLGEAKDILNKLAFVSELFDFKREARKHLGKPYSWGASYRTHGDMAFDCSYLTDYIYSLIGKFIGHTSLAQYMLGQPVEGDLAPGDILFVKGKIEKSVTDHYFIPDGSGGHKKIELKKPVEVGHNGLYIGGGRVVHAKHYKYDRKTNTWVKDGKGEVVEEDATVFTENPEYLGARRYVANPDKYLAIDAPWWRLDIKIEEDILEEIGRIYGYQNLPSTLPSGVPAKYDANKNYDFARSVKGALVGFGFNEVLNYSFVSGSVAECADLPLNSLFKVLNPLSPETEYMRASLAGSLITAASKNQDNYGDLRMFEIANTYLRVDGPMPKEQESICILIRHASGDRGVAFTELKGAINSLFEFIRAKKVTFKPSVGHLFAQGASAAILHNGKPIGSLGVLSKKVGMHYGLRGDVALCEIDLSALLASTDSKIVYRKLSKFPAVTRDIPILVSQKIAASEVLLAVTCLDNIFIKEAQIIDIYEGKGLPKDQKSITVRVVLGSDEKTLEEKEIEQVIGSILTNLEERVGGALRTNT